jgi:AhpD family alkylhydroperoxidase
MSEKSLYPAYTAEKKRRRNELAPKQAEAWENFSKTVFQAGALDEKTKQLIAVAVAHVTQCPYCIRGHVPQALKKGATKEEIMEAIWVAAEMRAGGASAHSMIAIDEMEELSNL